jgi:hypothetical protein
MSRSQRFALSEGHLITAVLSRGLNTWRRRKEQVKAEKPDREKKINK